MRELQQVFDDLGVKAQVVSTITGPSTVRYEVTMHAGERVDKVLKLDEHLSYLYGGPVRISAVRGKRQVVGIEVPGEQATVRLREVRSDAIDEIAIGKSIEGPVNVSLNSLPHMIVAGATGAGKSVFINSVITDLLLKNTPEQLRLVLVDPKRVELGQYNGVPHLMGKVIQQPQDAEMMLGRLVRTMMERYGQMEKAGVRHASELGVPAIVAVIDELADLMLVSGKAVESSIVRIAQLARAASIHLIVATQRPSAAVLTGLIKANMPTRLAFQTSGPVDSRIILDSSGAERLMGRGDALFRAAGAESLIRVQSPYVSDAEVERLVDHWK